MVEGRSYIKRSYDILLVTCMRIIERCVFVDHRSANVLMAEELAHLIDGHIHLQT